MTELSTNLLWDFSLEFYQQPQVADLLLALQDQADAEVNILLLCLWQASIGCAVNTEQLKAAKAAVARWQESLLKPMRQLRRSLKPPEPNSDDGLYKEAKALELAMERWEQDLLFTLFDWGVGDPGAVKEALAEQNLLCYFELGRAPVETYSSETTTLRRSVRSLAQALGTYFGSQP